MKSQPNQPTSTALARPDLAALDLPALVERTKETGRRSKADSTRKAYEDDWDAFSTWCSALGQQSLPASPGTVAAYLQFLSETPPRKRPEAKRSISTIARALAAICYEHKNAGEDAPSGKQLVIDTMDGLRRTLGVAPKRKAAVRSDHLRTIIPKIPETLLGLRDRALLLVGFRGAFRRMELVNLNVDDIEYTSEGMKVHLRRSKIDQEGVGRKVAISYGSSPEVCPVHAVQAWLEAAEITSGPIFRAVDRHWQVREGRLKPAAVAIVVKRYASAAGLSPRAVAGHSLRAGFVTSAVRAKKSGTKIREQTGHETPKMTDIYTREESLFEDNASTGLL